MSTHGAVLLIGFGGPESPQEVRPFLDRVLHGRPVPPDRYAAVVHHYELLGGWSPYNELTRRLAAGLRMALRRQGINAPVLIGLRNTPPFIADAMRALAADGVDQAVGFILAAFRCEASWDRYQREVAGACAAVGASAPRITYPATWHNHPQFIAAVADSVQTAIARLAATYRDRCELLFTAHSIPLAMAEASPYVAQLREAAALVAKAVGQDRWVLAFQSRSGNPRDRWLEPDIREALIANPQPKLVVPIGFLCDHVEVLYDLDIEAATVGRTAGIVVERAPTVGDHPAFIALMAELVCAHLAQAH